MITAIIRNKENTLVLELPHSIYDIYEKLQSIGIMQPPKRIPLTDNEGEDIGVKLFSESDFGQHLLLTLNEKNTIADANMLRCRPTAFIRKSRMSRTIGSPTAMEAKAFSLSSARPADISLTALRLRCWTSAVKTALFTNWNFTDKTRR